MQEGSKNEVFQLVSNSEPDVNLIEFTVKHTVELDQEFKKEIRIKKLSKTDVILKIQPQLYNLSSGSTQSEFLKFLSPELRYVLPSLFEKSKAKSKIKNLILNSYREFIQLLFNIISCFISSPIPAKSYFSASHQPRSNESNNSFARRMRA